MGDNHLAGDTLTSNMAGMSKNQLYEIMCQMNTLIDQNRQQAKQILSQNPQLAKALFQAQIMLGMVQPPQVTPNIQSTTSQHSQQSSQRPQQPNVQATSAMPGPIGVQEQTNASQPANPLRMQQPNQPVVPVASPSVTPINFQSQSLPSHPLQLMQQPKGHLNSQAPAMSIPQSSQVPNMHSHPLHSASQPPSLVQPPILTGSNQSQQPLQSSGIPQMQLQPPLPPQARPPSMPAFAHQHHHHMGPSASFQHSNAPQLHHSQPMFHSGQKHPPSMGPSFTQGQPPLPNQSPSQSLYQGGGSQFSQVGSSMQTDRGSPWIPGLPENATGPQLPGPPPFMASQMGPGSQPRPPPLSHDMEQALLQQVMSLTPEQINLLPPEQRNQVLQLQQMLRQ